MEVSSNVASKMADNLTAWYHRALRGCGSGPGGYGECLAARD